MAQVLLLVVILTSVGDVVEDWQLQRDPAVACFVGDARWCKAAALAAAGERDDDADGVGLAFRLLSAGCAVKDDASCASVVRMLRDGVGSEADTPSALLIGESVCDRRHPNTCEAYAEVMVQLADPEWEELQRAASLACDEEHPHACAIGCVNIWRAQSLATSLADACESETERLCRAGEDEMACRTLAQRYEETNRTPDAAAMLRESCEHDLADSCWLVVVYQRDAEDAEKLLSKACSGGAADACTVMARVEQIKEGRAEPW